MIEDKLVDQIIRSCDYCRTITQMQIRVELQDTSEYFCSQNCRNLYFKQHDNRIKV